MYQAKKGITPPPQIAKLRQSVRNVQLRNIAAMSSEGRAPAACMSLSDSDRAIVAKLRTQHSVHTRN